MVGYRPITPQWSGSRDISCSIKVHRLYSCYTHCHHPILWWTIYVRFRFALQLFTLAKKKQVLAYINRRNNHDNKYTLWFFVVVRLLVDCTYTLILFFVSRPVVCNLNVALASVYLLWQRSTACYYSCTIKLLDEVSVSLSVCRRRACVLMEVGDTFVK